MVGGPCCCQFFTFVPDGHSFSLRKSLFYPVFTLLFFPDDQQYFIRMASAMSYNKTVIKERNEGFAEWLHFSVYHFTHS